MKLLINLALATIFFLSCTEKKDSGIICLIDKNLTSIKNANTTFSVDNNIRLEISFTKYNENFNLTGGESRISFVSLTDTSGNSLSFTRKSARVTRINDKYGAGKSIILETESTDRNILSIITLSSYEQFPDVILVKSTFRNISEAGFPCHGYALNQLTIADPDETEWMTFQGASYNWGQDFVFKLPDSFSRDNYMGLNAIKAGSGIPLTDIWNREFGIALASIGDKPEYVSLPVNANKGLINMGVEERFDDLVISPGDSLNTIESAIIVHSGDFYNPLKKFSALIKIMLPDFQLPPEVAYQPEWCTWGFNQNFKPEDILNKLDTLKSLGTKSIILDDGWSVNHGDWIPDPIKFPSGDDDFKKLINTLHDNGFKVWLWWVPGYADSTSSLALGHPDWLIRNMDGSAHPSYGLCPAYAPVQEHYKNLVRKFTAEYKLDGFKLDFGEINSAAPCYNPVHHHDDPNESYLSTPLLFQNICSIAKQYNPQMILEYCSCGIPPNIFHLPFINLAVTSDPSISQITNRIKMYKALMGDDFPVLEEYCGVLAGPVYQLTIGSGGVPGTFSTYLDDYHRKWIDIYKKYQLSRGLYMNLYDIGFDYPETHTIKKDDTIYYAFYTHPWQQSGPGRLYRFGNEFDTIPGMQKEFNFPSEQWKGKVELRGLDNKKRYRIIDYGNDLEIGIIDGNKPFLDVSFPNYLLLEATPVR
jgi:alpha-galactosidase